MKKIKVIIPVCNDSGNKTVEKELKKYKDNDTKIGIINIEKGPESIESTYDDVWSGIFTVQEAEKAEREGYDGIIIYCFGDPGLRAAKEKLNIPVVGSNEPSLHIASLLGDKFSIICPGVWTSFLRGLLKLYGFEHKCASIRSIGISVLDLGKDKRRVAERAFEEAKKAVEEDGANVIIFGCDIILTVTEELDERVDERIKRELKVPVVHPGAAALKICEDLISMKITQSKQYFKTPLEGTKRIL